MFSYFCFCFDERPRQSNRCGVLLAMHCETTFGLSEAISAATFARTCQRFRWSWHTRAVVERCIDAVVLFQTK